MLKRGRREKLRLYTPLIARLKALILIISKLLRMLLIYMITLSSCKISYKSKKVMNKMLKTTTNVSIKAKVVKPRNN